MARISVDEAGGINVLAMIDVVAVSEIGPELMAVSDDGYNVIVGSTPENPILFNDYSKHPRVYETAENSTAAGRSQWIWPTWKAMIARYEYNDFTPITQDRATIAKFRERGAMQAILAGKIEQAIVWCNHEWASFSSAGYGQHENKMAYLVDAYNKARAVYGAAV
jgi:muramidase (phage lysozyme)